MFNFFDFIVDFINIIWTFIQNSINSLFNLLSVLTSGPVIITAMTPYMPTIITTCLGLVISCAIFKFILGR